MSNIKVYYCKQTENPGPSNRLSPAPSITINPEIFYSNDNVIGYNYSITLNGYANSLRKDVSESSTDFGIDKTVDHIGYIREVFNFNGGNLYIQKDNTTILVAKGATIQQTSFNESDNRWINYAPFTIQLSCNELDLPGCSNNPAIACNSSIFHAGQSKTVTADNLVDITKYKIKEFSDKWSFTIDNTIYNSPINSLFKISYNLSATGQNYYINDKLIPAWQQAKMFVQDRLYQQVKSLIGGVLQINVAQSEDGCDPDKDLDSLHSVNNIDRTGGLLSGFVPVSSGCDDINYGIYNETISCDTSESDGTFSIVYNATLKNIDPLLSPTANAVIHTVTHKLAVSDSQPPNNTITVDGNIQGLVRGGFIYHNNDFTLPQSGLFISTINSAETKYSNALNYYNAYIGNNLDLYDSFKETINVKKSQLSMKGPEGYPTVAAFSLDHNYHDGSLGYSATYDRRIAESLDRGFFNISVVRTDPVEMIQEFIIPGRSAGPIIQKLGMQTQRTVAINIEGSHPDNKGCIDFTTDDVCSLFPVFDIPNINDILQDSGSTWIKSKEDYTLNKIDGSFSISLEYICRG